MLQNHEIIQKSFYTDHIQNILCGLKIGFVDKIINKRVKNSRCIVKLLQHPSHTLKNQLGSLLFVGKVCQIFKEWSKLKTFQKSMQLVKLLKILKFSFENSDLE